MTINEFNTVGFGIDTKVINDGNILDVCEVDFEFSIVKVMVGGVTISLSVKEIEIYNPEKYSNKTKTFFNEICNKAIDEGAAMVELQNASSVNDVNVYISSLKLNQKRLAAELIRVL